MMKSSWQQIPMCTSDGNIPTGHNPDRIAAMREYRQDGEIQGVWLCDVDELETDPEGGTWLGPQPAEIDWIGFPTKGGA